MTRAQQVVLSAMLLVCGAAAALGQSSGPSDKADALWEAARKGDAPAVKKLLDEGVDVNTKFRYGATALSYACDRGNLEVVKILLERGADVNVKDKFYGATPLTWAASPATARTPQHPEIVKLLLEHGAQGKESALLAAVSESDAATTKVVLEHGGLSPAVLTDALESARKDGHQDFVALLEQAGAKPFVELKMDAAELARYAGTYRDAGGAEQVLTVAGGRLALDLGGQRLTWVARDETTFVNLGSPGITMTFRLEQGKAVALTLVRGPTATAYTRIEDK
jgi:ankyrin repeat protein